MRRRAERERLRCFILGSAASLVASTALAADPECVAKAPADVQVRIEEAIGLPVLQNGLVAAEDLAFGCHDRFCAEFNNLTRTPIWVAEHLNRAIVEKNFRRPQKTWEHDPNFADMGNIDSVSDDHYRNSGWARGHMAASADFSCLEEWMKQTFIFSNAVPQWQSGFNSGVWSGLEERIQNLARARGDVYVFTGPVHLPPDGSAIVIPEAENGCDNEIVLPSKAALGKSEICDANDNDPSKSCLAEEDVAGVAIPAGLYKIVHLPDSGRTFAFVIANESHTDRKKGFRNTDVYLDTWQVSVNVIEELVGVQFFPNLSLHDVRVMKEACAAKTFR